MDSLLPLSKAMKVWISTFFVLSIGYAADPQQLAMELKAQTSFDKVQLMASPRLADTGDCVQSVAAALAVSAPEDLATLYYRRGYCAFAGAAITGDARDYLAASADFERAMEAWPARYRKLAKKQSPEPVPPGLRILAALARLNATTDAPVRAAARQELSKAIAAPACTSGLMTPWYCEQVHQIGREWLGWFALGEGNLSAAAQYFEGGRGTGWFEWVDGQRLFQQGNYAAAVLQEERAISIWKAGTRRFSPLPDIPVAQADLGGAQLLAGNLRAAMTVLDASLKANPSNPHAFYRRARARELAGNTEAALADYGMASRVAFAQAAELASGEAHLYRGIVLYRRKNFERAEAEFSSALNFEIAAPMRADAQAWRHMAAVAGGSCVSAREFLDRTLPSVSPYFPAQEARQLAAACGTLAQAVAQ
jgi:tetratricopeptide (TPR) repeat protein